MKTAGFTHHVEIAEVMSGMTLHPKFVEAVETMFTSIPASISFMFTSGCDAIMYPTDKAQPAEEAEIEFDESAASLAYEIMHQIIKGISVETLIMHGVELIFLKIELEQYFENYLEKDGAQKAYNLAGDYESDRAASEADFRIDEAKDRRMEESWEE